MNDRPLATAAQCASNAHDFHVELLSSEITNLILLKWRIVLQASGFTRKEAQHIAFASYLYQTQRIAS